jgi:quercetin dioxygenase-like cupin family protein
MQPSLDIQRHNDGSIDFDFYHRRASRRRRLARRMIFKHYRSAIGKAAKASVPVLSLGDGDLRPVLRASVITAVLLAVAAFHAWAQGDSAHHIMVLPDEMKWVPAPASLPTGAQVAMIEGNPTKAEPLTMRLKFPAGYKIAPHTHPAIEHVTVLSGTFHIAPGDEFDQAKGKRLPAGSFVVMPTGMPHFAWASEETIIQLHSVGPWGVTYVNPDDDPRKK